MINTVYLAGPITSLSYRGATEWRHGFYEELKTETDGKIIGINPMRGKEYLSHLSVINAMGNELYGNLSGGKAIVTRDHWDVYRSDVILVNLLGANNISIGTMFEVAWAHAYKKPIILVIEDGQENIHSHDMLFELCGYRCSSLEDAKFIIKAIFNY